MVNTSRLGYAGVICLQVVSIVQTIVSLHKASLSQEHVSALVTAFESAVVGMGSSVKFGKLIFSVVTEQSEQVSAILTQAALYNNIQVITFHG